MRRLGVFAVGSVLALSACVAPESGAVVGVDRNLRPVAALTTDALRAKADPQQNLSDVRIDARDGCLVYRYAGPVETTYLPLRNTEGRPICTPQEAPAEA